MFCSAQNTERKPNQPVGTTQYNVGSRDTLRSIAVNFNTTPSNLMKLNKMSSSYIFPDQVIFVPETNILKETAEKVRPTSGSSFDGDFSFLAPLSASPPSPEISFNKSNQFQDLLVVSVQDSLKDANCNSKLLTKFAPVAKQPENNSEIPTTPTIMRGTSQTSEDGHNQSGTRKRVISNESDSDKFEENFIKTTVRYITSSQETVEGTLLVTPTNIMFDPDRNDPLAIKHGCEKFGIMCNLTLVTSVSMFSDKGCMVTSHSTQSTASKDAKSDTLPPQDVTLLAEDPDAIVTTSSNQEPPKSPSNQSDSSERITRADLKLKEEFPFLDSIVKSVGDFFSEEDLDSTMKPPAQQVERMYLCVRSDVPMMKTFSTHSELDAGNSHMTSSKTNDQSKETWFQTHRDRSDQLLAFFMQWNPDPYALDFAEQNGFVVMDPLTEFELNDKTKCDLISKEDRGRTSTNTSLEFIEDFFSDSRIEKEWEIVSVDEARRRSTLGAIELANDDTSLMPDLLDSSNLLNDDTLLELCRHIPARTIGCPWKLLYSTFEHGISLRTLYRKVASKYNDDTPVVLIVQDSGGQIFGAFCSNQPHVSEHFYGTGETFLFTLEPNITIFPWSGENNFFVKGNLDSLAIGGGDGSSGLWLDGDLCHGSSHTCLTFQNDPLASSEDFFIQNVEVWGFDNN
uniref:Oxidation resistance protein 1 n=1 Tax=Ciona savignyi TaxID=51511 RepID=H2YD23_CIOSA